MENPKTVEGRVIKFRAWSGTKMYYPRPGCDLLIRLDGRKFVQDDIGENSGLSPADDLVFMQFTGLLDKNGNEIYEGDMVRCGESEHTVEMGFTNNCGECGWVWGWDMPEAEETLRKSGEVIGNIFENPDLIEARESYGGGSGSTWLDLVRSSKMENT